MGAHSKRAGSRCGRAMVLFAGLALVALMLVPAVPALAQVAPTINNVLPVRGPVNTPVTITGSNLGTNVPTSKVTFNGVAASPIFWNDTLIEVLVPAGATTGPVVVSTIFGDSNAVNFEVTSVPQPQQTWYLAEGSTAYGFDSYIMIQNTTPNDATVQITYNTSFGRIPRPGLVGVPASARVTLHVNSELPNMDFSTTLAASQPVVVERSMYWNNRIEGTESIGTTAPNKNWYLSEGYTDQGFQTYVLVQNPQTASTTVNITYMSSKGVVKKQPFTVGAGQRYTVDVNKDVPGAEVSTQVTADQDVVCERSMYWDNKRGGHDSIGVTQGSKSWYLAEGSTRWGYNTYVLIQNPTSNWANIDVSYDTAGGPQVKPRFMMPPQSRKTIYVNGDVPNTDTSIQVISDQDVIAERSMYWNNGTGRAGHETVGMPAPATSVFLAEGSTAWGFDTFVCIQNPNDVSVNVNVTFMTNSGAVLGPTVNIARGTRVTLHLNDIIPNVDVATKIQCNMPIMAERAMYWNNKGGGTSSIGWTQ